jgi:hypothetical protein
MPISGLVITLERLESRTPLLARLEADPRISVGPPQGLRLPVVTDTPDSEEGEALVRELFSLPGVCFVDVVSIDFSDEED